MREVVASSHMDCRRAAGQAKLGLAGSRRFESLLGRTRKRADLLVAATPDPEILKVHAPFGWYLLRKRRRLATPRRDPSRTKPIIRKTEVGPERPVASEGRLGAICGSDGVRPGDLEQLVSEADAANADWARELASRDERRKRCLPKLLRARGGTHQRRVCQSKAAAESRPRSHRPLSSQHLHAGEAPPAPTSATGKCEPRHHVESTKLPQRLDVRAGAHARLGSSAPMLLLTRR